MSAVVEVYQTANGTAVEVYAPALPGATGNDGESAYELALDQGFEGTLDEWLASLVGPQGDPGDPGADGQDGTDGTNGTNGTNGESAYQLAVDGGFSGTPTQWLASLHGADGQDGTDGTNGTDGADGREVELQVGGGFIQWRYEGDADWADLVALSTLKGDQGDPGADGTDGSDGESAYQIAVDNGFVGNQVAWLASLKGADGTDGMDGTDGTNGSNGLSVLHGHGVPASGTGVDGEFYIDVDAWDIYGPKVSGAWGSATSLVGPAGSGGSGGTLPGWFVVTADPYDADNTGATSADAGVNAAIADLNAAGGGTLYFPAGLYDFDDELDEITVPCTIRGDGAGDLLGENAATQLHFDSATGYLLTLACDGILIRDIALENPVTTSQTAGAGIRVTQGNNNRYENISIRGFYDCMDIEDGALWVMDGCAFSGPVNWGLYIRHIDLPDGGDMNISGTSIYAHTRNAAAAIRYESGGGLKMQGCKLNMGPAGSGQWAVGVDMELVASTAVLVITGNSIENCTQESIKARGLMVGLTITGNEIGYYGDITHSAIDVSGQRDVVVTGNAIFNESTSTKPAIQFADVEDGCIALNTWTGFTKEYDLGTSPHESSGIEVLARQLADLADVDFSTPPTDGQTWLYDETDHVWKPAAPPGGVTSVVAGDGIDVDDTDPANPIVIATGGGGGGGGGGASSENTFWTYDPGYDRTSGTSALESSHAGTWELLAGSSGHDFPDGCIYNSSDGNGDAIDFEGIWGPGDFTLEHYTDSPRNNRGITTWQIEDDAGTFQDLVTVDHYGAPSGSQAIQISSSDVTMPDTVTAVKRRRLRCLVDGKNASSSDYFTTIFRLVVFKRSLTAADTGVGLDGDFDWSYQPYQQRNTGHIREVRTAGAYGYTGDDSVVGRGFIYNTSHAQNDALEFWVWLTAGTYDLNVVGGSDGNRGIITWAIDDGSGTYTDLGTMDFYGSSVNDVVQTLTGVTVTGLLARRKLRAKVATKNASSSDYYMSLQQIDLVRTA